MKEVDPCGVLLNVMSLSEVLDVGVSLVLPRKFLMSVCLVRTVGGSTVKSRFLAKVRCVFGLGTRAVTKMSLRLGGRR